MISNKLNQAFDYVEDEYLDIVEEEKVSKKSRKSLQKWGGLAASIGLVIVSAFVISKLTRPSLPESREEMALEEISENNEEANQEIVQDIMPEDSYAELSDLLVSPGISTESLYYTSIYIEDYQAVYTKESAVSSEELEKSIGSNVDGLEDTFYLSGHNDLQYVIKRDENNVYELWKFESFEGDEYPYSDVLELIYGVSSEDDIVSVISMPANMDNTDEGIRAQEEIGRLEITNRDDISELYQVISNMTCYGNDNWDMIDYGASDTGMVEGIRKGRYLIIELANGNIIDGLKYTGISGMFYEFSGIAYNKLDDASKENVERILEIDK